MSRMTRTILKFGLIILVTFICSALFYYLISSTVGHQLSTASGNMVFERWQEKFSTLTKLIGGFTGLCSLVWFFMARAGFKLNSPSGVGRRTFWAVIAAASTVGSIAIPMILSSNLGIKINVVVYIFSIIIFTGIGYWLLSIVTTPKSFKYTPVGAMTLLNRNK